MMVLLLLLRTKPSSTGFDRLLSTTTARANDRLTITTTSKTKTFHLEERVRQQQRQRLYDNADCDSDGRLRTTTTILDADENGEMGYPLQVRLISYFQFHASLIGRHQRVGWVGLSWMGEYRDQGCESIRHTYIKDLLGQNPN